MRAINNKSKVNLKKIFENFETSLLKFAQILQKMSS